MARRKGLLPALTAALVVVLFAAASPAYALRSRSHFVFARPHARVHVFARPFFPRARFVPRHRFFHPRFGIRVFAGYPYSYPYPAYSYPYPYYGPPAGYCAPGYY